MAPRNPTVNPKLLTKDKKTPIRVRGKRRPKNVDTVKFRKKCVDAAKDSAKTLADIDESELLERIVDEDLQEENTTKNNTESRKFWVIESEKFSAERNKFRRSCKPSKTTVGKPARASTLESLPTELIEQIFLECLEINLPRASPYIASLLSNPRLYRILIIYALWHDPKPNCKISDEAVAKKFRPIKYKPLSLQDKKRLQHGVLTSAWCTFKLVRSCFKDMVELSVLRGEYLECDNGYIEVMPERIAEKIEYVLPSWYLDEVKGHLDLSQVLFAVSFLTPSFPGKSMYPLRVLVIPDKFIDGKSWTEEKTEFFKYLRSFMVPIKDQETLGVPFSQDILHEGVHTAIMEDNYNALASLLEFEEHCYRTTSFPLFKDKYPPPYHIPAQHFLTVVRNDLDPEIFKTLLRANAESVPYDNPEVTGWAMRLYKTQPNFSSWLLDLLTDIPRRRRDVEEGKRPLFVCGMVGPNKLGCDYNGKMPCRLECCCATTQKALGKSAFEPWIAQIANTSLPDGAFMF